MRCFAMRSIRMSAGLALLTLGLGVWRAWGQQVNITECGVLKTEIEEGGTSFVLGRDIICDSEITITNEVTIDGAAEFTLQIGRDFVHGEDRFAAIYNEGTLTLTGLTMTVDDEVESGFRAIYNEGDLTVNSCNFNGFNLLTEPLEDGGVIYSNSQGGTLVIEGSQFKSNAAGTKGGAICATGTEELTIMDCEFNDNEAGTTDSGEGSGGDVYAADGVTLIVESSSFLNSAAEYGGAAIECCGGTITSSSFTGAESFSIGNENYGGAVLVGRPDSGCSQELVVMNSNFSRCSVDGTNGAGGALAVFDTSASLEDCLINHIEGTAVLFRSSKANGAHKISMTSLEFEYNSNPASAYASSGLEQQGTAFVLENTAAEEDEIVAMGTFDTVHCFSNDPYECEMIFDLGSVTYTGEIKCQICNIDSERQWEGLDQDSGANTGDDTDDSSASRSSDSNEGIVIGLSLALGLTLVVIGALAVWKIRVRRNARRLMDDMGDGDL